MFEIGAVDITAEARQRLVSLLHAWVHNDPSTTDLVPQLSIRSISPDEVKFQSGLDLCVVGPEFLVQDIARLGQLKRYLGAVPCVCVTDARASSLTIADQVARLGAEDIFRTDSNSGDFLRRILFFVRRNVKQAGGRTILVDSGKGGSGSTSVTAGLAEALVDAGNSVCLVDGDFQSQDLSRFLLARPFINEPFELLLTGQRGISAETVAECVRPVWKRDDGLFIVTPPADSFKGGTSSPMVAKVFGAFVEALRSKYDFVLVDLAECNSLLSKALFSSAQHVLYVASGDPAGFPAAGMRLSSYNGLVGKETSVTVVLNGSDYDGLTGSLGLRELKKLLPSDQEDYQEHVIPSCRTGRQWPASGRTIYSHSKKINRALNKLASSFFVPSRNEQAPSVAENTPELGNFALLRWYPRLLNFFRRSRATTVPRVTPQGLLNAPNGESETLAQLVSQPQFIE